MDFLFVSTVVLLLLLFLILGRLFLIILVSCAQIVIFCNEPWILLLTNKSKRNSIMLPASQSLSNKTSSPTEKKTTLNKTCDIFKFSLSKTTSCAREFTEFNSFDILLPTPFLFTSSIPGPVSSVLLLASSSSSSSSSPQSLSSSLSSASALSRFPICLSSSSSSSEFSSLSVYSSECVSVQKRWSQLFC